MTKNALVKRDCDILAQLAEDQAVIVFLSVTTLDAELARRLEPRASTPARRLAALSALSEAGIPVGVMVAPIIPGLTDHEIPVILEAAARAGAQFAGHTIVRLPYSVSDPLHPVVGRSLPRSEKQSLKPDSIYATGKAQ